ncbi:MAG: MFS transporter [Hyphomonadaceae bacterium]|nr:MFS transporter [Hyphomonadaceae bacterium]
MRRLPVWPDVVRVNPALASLFSSRAARVTLVMSALFAASGVIMVFFPRWLEGERGLTGAEIGAILALAQFGRVITGPLIAMWADAAPDKYAPLRIMSLATLGAYGVFFFVADGFWGLLALGFIALTLSQAMTPLVEAATLQATAQGRFGYGFARGVGSIAFICANVAGGALVARFGLDAVIAWVLASMLALNCATWFGLPKEPRPTPATVRHGAAMGDLLRRRRYLILIVSCGLIQSAHGFYYGFSTLVWRGQGVPPDMVGLLWAFGVAVEVAFLWSLSPIERRISPETLIVWGAAGGVLRWAVLGFAPLGFVLWPLQALHTLSFAAAHVGAMRLLSREFADNGAAMAQMLYAVLSGGVLMGASTLLSGYLYDLVGAQGYWAMAVIALFGGGLALLLRAPTRSATPR